MLHVALALYLFSFSLGIAVVVLSLLAFARFHSVVYRQLAVLFSGALLIVIVDMLKMYDRATIDNFGALIRLLYAFLSFAGFGLFAYSMPAIGFRVCSLPLSGKRKIVHFIIVVVVAFIGGWHELSPQPALEVASAAALIGVQVYGLLVVLPRLGGIKNPQLLVLMRRFLVLFAIGIAATVADVAASSVFGSRAALLSLPLVQLLYFFGAVALLLSFALRYSFVEEEGSTCLLPATFISKYGISPRECEIVSLIVRGYSNRMVAETLFISAMTVKNHIYHIYQKTGVENKIQLLNLINPAK